MSGSEGKPLTMCESHSPHLPYCDMWRWERMALRVSLSLWVTVTVHTCQINTVSGSCNIQCKISYSLWFVAFAPPFSVPITCTQILHGALNPLHLVVLESWCKSNGPMSVRVKTKSVPVTGALLILTCTDSEITILWSPAPAVLVRFARELWKLAVNYEYSRVSSPSGHHPAAPATTTEVRYEGATAYLACFSNSILTHPSAIKSHCLLPKTTFPVY